MHVASAFQFDDESRLVALAQALNTVPASRLSARVDRMLAYLAAGHGPVSEAEDIEALRRRRAKPVVGGDSGAQRALTVIPDDHSCEARPSAPAASEALHRLLLRGALAGKVDLDSWISIDAFLIVEGVAAEDLNRITEADLDEVRRRLQRRGTLLDWVEGVVERLEEAGVVTPALTIALVLAALYLAHALSGQAQAAVSEPAGPTPSSLAGLLVALVPVIIACLFAAYALGGTAPTVEDETFGDTTGFGERDL